jgi:hypothetical protein
MELAVGVFRWDGVNRAAYCGSKRGLDGDGKDIRDRQLDPEARETVSELDIMTIEMCDAQRDGELVVVLARVAGVTGVKLGISVRLEGEVDGAFIKMFVPA